MEDKILMGHGSGGKLMNKLIKEVISRIFGKEDLQIDDSAILSISNKKISFTTDTFTISPIFFYGGNIGKLAVNGTVNDLAVMGSRPLYLSCGLVIEEGLKISQLELILRSMKEAAEYAEIKIVTGDTKVVEKGKADRIFINTSGIGILENAVQRRNIKIGDRIIINGTIGDHGISIAAERNGLSFTRDLKSDCVPLNHLILPLINEFPESIKFIRDATRGGVASVLNEIVEEKPYGIKLIEKEFPVKEEVKAVCDILGIDPIYAANEGKIIIVANQDDAEKIVDLMRTINEGKESEIIGEVSADYSGSVYLETVVGGKRILPLLTEDQLPRIC